MYNIRELFNKYLDDLIKSGVYFPLDINSEVLKKISDEFSIQHECVTNAILVSDFSVGDALIKIICMNYYSTVLNSIESHIIRLDIRQH